MPVLHDDRYRTEILRRVESLTPESQGRWGKMSVNQMLWHVNEAMEGALGRITVSPGKVPLPRPLMKFIVINMPWPKGAPTLARWVPRHDDYDFAAERRRCLRLIDELVSKRLDDEWADSPTLGRMSGKEVSRLHAKHLNHHLTQFGV
jgi:hypothetical protein